MTWYEVLGVDPTATLVEIRTAYRRLSLQHHPDRNQGEEGATRVFQHVVLADEWLSTAKKRAKYDRALSRGEWSSDSPQVFEPKSPSPVGVQPRRGPDPAESGPASEAEHPGASLSWQGHQRRRDFPRR